MIKFFRHIRKNLLMENKTSKYFKYAIGEIILVVIGILIALQINNWNETLKQERNALELCKRLLEETTTNINIIKEDIKRHDSLLSADLALLNMMGEDYQNKDARRLDSLMAFTLVAPKLVIQSSVLNQTLNNKELTKSIQQDLKNKIYEIPLLIDNIHNSEESIDQYVNDQLVPIMSTEYSIRNMDSEFSQTMKHIGPSKFNRDSRKLLSIFAFENILDNKYFIFNMMNNNYKQLLNGLIDLELALKNNIKYLND